MKARSTGASFTLLAAALVAPSFSCSSNEPGSGAVGHSSAGDGGVSGAGHPSNAGATSGGRPNDGGASGAASGVAPSACKVTDQAIPADAFLVPLAERANLQALLDAHANVRLDGGNYSKGGPAQLTIASDHGIYGNGQSGLPLVVVPAGTTGAVLSGTNGPVRFDAGGDQVTHDNCFQHLSSSVTGEGVSLERNEFLDFHESSLSFDTQAAGFVRNNRFVRLMLHGGGDAVIRLVGDAGHKSYGNVVFWLNALGAPLDTIVGEHQRDFTVVGADGESYGTAAPGAKAMFYTRDVDSLRIHTASGRVITPAFDLGATDISLFNAYTGTTGPDSNFVLQPGVARAGLFASPQVQGANPPTLRVEGPGNLQPFSLTLDGSPWTAAPTGEKAALLRGLLAPARAGRPWARPTLPPIADPAGSSWSEGLADKPDDAPLLQQLLDTQHVVELEARAYYLGSALALGTRDGLIGKGAERTVLIAKTPTIDLLTTKLPPLMAGANAQSFMPTLVDLTLQGGQNGLHMNQPGTQMTIAYIDHVTFRNMSNAGIFADHVYGVDNDMFAYAQFYQCGAGYKARTDTGPANDSTPDLGYTDKTVFYRSQFVRCGLGIDSVGRRQNNLNAYFESSFRENTKAAFHSEPDASTIIASSEFIDNRGDPVIETATTVINCYFRAGEAGVTMLGPSGTVEGSTFQRGASTTAQVLSTKLRGDARDAPILTMSNSRSELPLGAIESSEIIALLIGNSLAADPPLSGAVILNAYDTKRTPAIGDDTHELLRLLDDVAPTAGSQLLFEAD